MARFCKHCGAQISDNAKFCRGCGRTVDAPVVNNTGAPNQAPNQATVQHSGTVPAGPVCPNCGNAIRPGAKFCRGCGYNFAQSGVATNVYTGVYQQTGSTPQNMTEQYRQNIRAGKTEKPQKEKDPYGFLKVLLIAASIGLCIAGVITVPARINSARNGSINSASEREVAVGGKAGSDKQEEEFIREIKAEYENIAEAGNNREEITELHVHDGLDWYNGDENGWKGASEMEGEE